MIWEMGNVVIVTHWLDGDVIPFIRVGRELKRRGHDVTLITHCHFQEMAEMAGLSFRSWDTPEEYNILVESMQQNKTDDSQENHYSFSSSEFRQRYESNEIRLKEYNIVLSCCRSDTVILCKNRSSIAAYLVAEKLGLSLGTVMMNPTEVKSMLLYEDIEGMNDLPRLNALRDSVGLPPIKSWLQWESSARMTLAFWPTWFDEADEEWPSTIETIGFPIEQGKEAYQREVPSDFQVWIEQHPNPIVITGGTTKCIHEDFYTNSIAACDQLGQPTVVLTQYREFLPEKLPDNVIWFDALPLDMILPQVSLLIHHGGMGTLSGALAAGVPQLILPCYVDRPYNATLIKKLGVGDYLYLANWQPEKIASLISQTCREEIISNCKKYMAIMKENSGVTIAADRVEQMMGNDQYRYSINLNYTSVCRNEVDHDCGPDTHAKQGSRTDKQKALLLDIIKRKRENLK